MCGVKRKHRLWGGKDNSNAYARKEGKSKINDVSFCIQNQKIKLINRKK